MKTFLLYLFLSFTFLFSQTFDTLFVLQTTDVHGNVYPYDYFNDKPADYGLAKIYTQVADYRLKHKNVLLLDSGDLLQGTPLIYYFNKIETDVPNPMILALNYMKYEAFSVGNHDIEQGLFVYDRARTQSDFPWLSANSLLPDGSTYFKPYTIIEKNGIKIGIIGLTTPAIPLWLNPDLYPGITWEDMITTARKYRDLLRPQVDILIGLFHAGTNAEYDREQTSARGLPNGNASRLVAEKVPGFDLILAGHSHKRIPYKKTVTLTAAEKTPLIINAGSRAYNLGVARIIIRIDNNSRSIEEKKGWLEPMNNVKASPAIISLTRYYHQKTLDYIHTPIGVLKDTLCGKYSRFKDTPYIQLINQAQLNYSGADISFAASFNDRLDIAPCTLQVKNAYAMYRYENYLYVIQMTGKQIKDFLEYSSRYYVYKDGKLETNPDFQGYNYDMGDGIGYEIHVKNRPGNRIKNLVLLKDNKPLQKDKIYKVVMNSYRATGGGGHLAAAGIKSAVILSKSNMEMRNILIDYIKKIKVIDIKTDNNWKIVY
jgi:2',3'-cyclic-nucleotide 2'-phosphodiesterase/3'-nucleotidase